MDKKKQDKIVTLLLQHMGGASGSKRLFDCLLNNERAQHFCRAMHADDVSQEMVRSPTDKHIIKEKFGITEDALSVILFASPLSINRTLIQFLSSVPKHSAKASATLVDVRRV